MKQLIAAIVLGVAAWVIAMFHPFDLALPWQTGDSTSVNLSMQRIMGQTEFELVEADWGRITPFNYVAANGLFVATGQPSDTCVDLREVLDAWGRVVDTARTPSGCVLEALGPGPMAATITLNETERRQLEARVKVQHRP